MRNKLRKISGLSEENMNELTEIKDKAKKYRRLNSIVIFLAYLIGDFAALAFGLPGYFGLLLQILLPVLLILILSKKFRKKTNQTINVGGFGPSWYDRHANFKSVNAKVHKNISNDGLYTPDIPYDKSFEEHLNKN